MVILLCILESIKHHVCAHVKFRRALIGNYIPLYQANPHGLGKPFKAFVDFFKDYNKKNARVLDVGCGQGRDALFVARLGHHVVCVDIAETGIQQMLKDTKKQLIEIAKKALQEEGEEHQVNGGVELLIINKLFESKFRQTLAELIADGHIILSERDGAATPDELAESLTTDLLTRKRQDS